MRALVLVPPTVMGALACLACAGDGTTGLAGSPTVAMTPSLPPSVAAMSGCEDGAAGTDPFRVVPRGERVLAVADAVSDALPKAAEVSRDAYGWAPADPICVYVFPGDVTFLKGLQELGGFDEAALGTYQTFLGTIGRDLATGREAIFLNAIFPDRMPFLAVHEYFHIVQGHTGGPPATPTWFLEGVADWEALKLQPPPHVTWFPLLISEERAGRSPSLSSLATWDQWRRVVAGGNPAVPSAGYHKARAAAMFLEQIAGPTAAAQILRGGTLGNVSSFGDIFRDVTGLNVSEFEARLHEFLVSSSPSVQPSPLERSDARTKPSPSSFS